MPDTRLVLSGLWVATMLTYLWGDVLRIIAGDVTPGEMNGAVPSPGMWLAIAALMLVSIVMVVLNLIVPYPAIRWINVGAAAFVILLSLAGFPYAGPYDNFLIIVSFVWNAMTLWYAWRWIP